TSWAVHNITGREDPRPWLKLTYSEREHLEQGMGYGAVEKPLFRWHSDDCLGDGYNLLGPADSRRFIDFLVRAGDENWPAPRISANVQQELELTDKATPRFRDVRLTRELSAQVRKKRNRFARPFVLRYFG